jgi:shikimate kinase
MILKLVRTPGIYLTGFMGSGKTTIAKLLADRLGWDCVDLDQEIEAEQRMSIPELFESRGEKYFRQVETEAIRKQVHKVRSGCPTVIALGGGAFVSDENYELLSAHGITVWLDCPLELARKRTEGCTNRPLARDGRKFAELYEARKSSYARSDYRVDVSSGAEAAVNAIEALPVFK